MEHYHKVFVSTKRRYRKLTCLVRVYIFDLTRCASYTLWHILPFPFLLFLLVICCQFMLLLVSLLIVAHIWSCVRFPFTSHPAPGSILPQPLHLARGRMRNFCCLWLRYMMVWLGILSPHGSSAPDQALLSIYRLCWLIMMAAVVGFLVDWMVVLWLWRFLCWDFTRKSHSHRAGCTTVLW